MNKFTDLVSDILTEQPANVVTSINKPEWLKKIIDKHKQLQFGDVNDDIYNKVLAVAFRPIQNRIAKKEIESVYSYVRILDAIEQFKQATGDPKQVDRSILTNQDPDYKAAGDKIANEINGYTNPDQWEPKAPLVVSTYYALKDEQDKLAAVALQTLDNKSILEATLEIVKRRTNIFDRISNLKSITQPFANLVNDIFRYPDEYIAGQKKVTSDFFNIVDSLYVTNLFQIGKAAKDLYATQITQLKTEPQDNKNQTQQQPSQDQNLINPDQQFYDSKNYFEQLVNSILLNEAGVLQTLGQAAQNIGSNIKTAVQAASTPENRQLFGQIFKKVRADQANYTSFLTNKQITYKIVDQNGKEVGTGQTDPNMFTIGGIKQINSPEARALIKALQSIAQYTRKKVGAGAALRGIGKFNSGIGPVN